MEQALCCLLRRALPCRRWALRIHSTSVMTRSLRGLGPWCKAWGFWTNAILPVQVWGLWGLLGLGNPLSKDWG